MQEQIIFKIVSIVTLIVWLMMLTIYFTFKKKRTTINAIRSAKDASALNCKMMGSQIKRAKRVHKVNVVTFIFVSLLLMIGAAFRLKVFFSNAESVGGNLMYFINPSVLVAWLFCLGTLIITKSFVNFYIAVAQKCKDLGLSLE